jgi:crossover junction endodeoxyribonuclease RuvC
MIIFGIDPGFAITGYGVVEKLGNKYRVLDYGVITTKAGLDLSVRLNIMYEEIVRKFDEHKPDCVAMEELFFCKNLTTGIAVAHGRGVLLLAINKLGKPFYEYTPLQIKQAITGYGKADKKQMQKMVQVLLKLDSIPKPDDAADALAVALCCGNSERF